MNKIEIGDVFGRITIKEITSNKLRGSGELIGECCCGNIVKSIHSDLVLGRTTSCGCGRIKHGMSRSVEYKTWSDIKKRCLNKKSKEYKDYGLRGIKISEEWMNFENFFKDMGKKPKGMSIDRIDNNGNYCKENCKWSTPKEQSGNRRNTKKVKTEFGEILFTEYAKILNINQSTLYDRLYRSKRNKNKKQKNKSSNL